MPPVRRKRKRKGDASDASDVQTNAVMDSPKAPVRVRHTESVLSSSEAEDGKKHFKPGTPLTTRAAAASAADINVGAANGAAASVAAHAASSAAAASSCNAASRKREIRSRMNVTPKNNVIENLRAITTSHLEELMVDGVQAALGKVVLAHSGLSR